MLTQARSHYKVVRSGTKGRLNNAPRTGVLHMPAVKHDKPSLPGRVIVGMCNRSRQPQCSRIS